jgi:hypothetical protein
MTFAEMTRRLTPAKVEYVCSAHYFEQVAALNLTAEQRELLDAIPRSPFREMVRDFMVNQQFRRDYWVKGARRLEAMEYSETVRAQRVILTTPRSEISPKFATVAGEIIMQEEIFGPILDVLADQAPVTLGEIHQKARNKVPYSDLFQAIIVLIGGGHLSPAQSDATAAVAKHRTDRLNMSLLDKARDYQFSYLASPMTGGGIAVDRIKQLFLLALKHGRQRPHEWAQYAWLILSARGEKILKDDKALDTEQENLAELNLRATAFAEMELPVLKALQIT